MKITYKFICRYCENYYLAYHSFATCPNCKKENEAYGEWEIEEDKDREEED